MQQRLLKPRQHPESQSLPALLTREGQQRGPGTPAVPTMPAMPAVPTMPHVTETAEPAPSLYHFDDIPLFAARSPQAQQPTPLVQTKLAVSQPGDPAEQEAERTADEVMADYSTSTEHRHDDTHDEGHTSQRQVMRVTPMVHRCGTTPCNCSPEERQRKAVEAAEEAIETMRGGEDDDHGDHARTLHRHAGAPSTLAGDVGVATVTAATSGGSPLDRETRAFMEPRFGHSFADVRVHTDERAAASAASVNALAYTVGRDIVFAAGQYQPTSSEGRHLLAHELTHVMQQSDGLPALQRQPDAPPADTQTAQPALDTSLPPGSPYFSFPPELLDTLRVSFVELANSDPSQGYNIWRGQTKFEAVLENIGTVDLETLTAVYQRSKAAGIWTYVHSIRDIWTGTSRGIHFNSAFVNELAAAVQASDKFCKDTIAGEALHPGFSCWREVVDNTPGLHVCLSGGVLEIHIDMHQTILGTITGINVFGLNPFNDKPLLAPKTCLYDPTAVLAHWNDLEGSGSESIFERISRQRNTISGMLGEYNHNSSGGQRDYQPEIPHDLNDAKDKLDALEPALRRFAVEGFKGAEDASKAPNVTETVRQVDDTIQKVRSKLASSEPPPITLAPPQPNSKGAY